MGAITDRLEINLQDVKQWLKIPLDYRRIVVDVLSPIVVGHEYKITIVNDDITYEYDYTAVEGDTPEIVAAALVLDMTTGGGALPTGLAAANLGSGKYQVRLVSLADNLFTAIVSRGQSPEPIPELLEDILLNVLLTAALDMADEYCNNEFMDADGNDEPIPDAVRVGVLQIVDWLYADYSASSAASSGSSGPSGPIKKRKAGDVEITYTTPGEVRASLGARGAISDLPAFAVNILAMYRLAPGYETARTSRPKPFGLAQMNDNVSYIPGDPIPDDEG